MAEITPTFMNLVWEGFDPPIRMIGDIMHVDEDVIAEVIDQALIQFPDKTGQVLNVLGSVQAYFRYIPSEAIELLSKKADVPRERLEQVCDFFKDLDRTQIGDHLIVVCDGTACHTRGANEVIQLLEQHLGISVGQTTDDGRYTLRSAHCVGSCGLAPVVIVDDKVLGRLRLADAMHMMRIVG